LDKKEFCYINFVLNDIRVLDADLICDSISRLMVDVYKKNCGLL